MVAAWNATDAFEVARLIFVIDADDPRHPEYFEHHANPADPRAVVYFVTEAAWHPLVPKLNAAALRAASAEAGFEYIGFLGDDHVPRTRGWAQAMIRTLDEMETGIVYPDDGFQHEKLPTCWAMSADIIRALGRMVPADVAHMFCDNSLLVLGRATNTLRYLPEVLIEHMHPAAGKGNVDSTYALSNNDDRYRGDEARYRLWLSQQRPRDVQAIEALKGVARGE